MKVIQLSKNPRDPGKGPIPQHKLLYEPFLWAEKGLGPSGNAICTWGPRMGPEVAPTKVGK